MKKIMLPIVVLLSLIFVREVSAADSYWNQCGNGTPIVRCETYDCPQGDTNKDGRCNLNDDRAKLQESKNDAFCANPLSGCGEVLYYTQDSVNSCAIRVKENQNNCDLYKAGNPNITPSPTASATATPRPSSTPLNRFGDATASPTAKPATTLPKTGPALWISIGIALLGVYGLYVSEKGQN